MNLSKKIFSGVAVCLFATLMSSVSSAALIALKGVGDTTLDQTTDGGGAIHADFLALTSSDIVNVVVNDTGHHDNTNANSFYGDAATLGSSQDDKLFKFDLAALSGSTVARAELRLWQVGGNNVLRIARNLHHDVDESTARRNSPLGTGGPAAPDGWGVASDSKFGAGDYGILADFDSNPAGARYVVADVTSDVQGFADGSLANLGWAVISLNRTVATSEFGTDGLRPVLFVDYEAVPEPSTALMLVLGLSLVGSSVRRARS